MVTLKGAHIYLRALEPEDLEFLHQIENDESIWEVSSTQTPYSLFILKQYLNNAQADIYEAKQLRLAISNYDNDLIGLIDLYDFDPKNSRAGVGIIVANAADRNRGIGSEALQLLINYAFSHLNLHQLYANIAMDNGASIHLFSNHGFELVGVKKDWNYSNGSYKDELLYQKIKA